MAHQISANLTDLKALAAALKELEWYTGPGGYQIAGVEVGPAGEALWSLESRPAEAPAAAQPNALPAQGRRLVEPGDEVLVETKGAQMSRRFGGAGFQGVEGTVFRVLTRGPHPHGMKVQLRDGTVGRVKKNVTAPGAGEPTRQG